MGWAGTASRVGSARLWLSHWSGTDRPGTSLRYGLVRGGRDWCVAPRCRGSSRGLGEKRIVALVGVGPVGLVASD